jgi:uncharacterized protein YndB with AHSA1/START domain
MARSDPARASCDAPRMQIDQTFEVTAAPESVFDYMTNPANLQQWQTSKTRVEDLHRNVEAQG